MIGKVSVKYALKSLWRHPRRTILSMLGVGIGCAFGLIAVAFYAGAGPMQIRMVAESGGGHLRVVPNEWPEKRENLLRIVDWRKALETVKALPGVKRAADGRPLVAVRARTNGLLALGNRTAVVEVVGVDPTAERASNRLVYKSENEGKIEGRYLQPGDSGRVVIGRRLAKKLDVGLEDDLFATLAGPDEMKGTMLTVAGIVETGSKEIDESFCHVALEDIEKTTGCEGPGEIAVILEDHSLIDSARKALAERLAGKNTVVTWKAVNPAIAANVEGDTKFMHFLAFIIIIVVAFGIVSAQLAAVLERRREFAILSALGMKGRQFAGLMMLEALIVGLGGAVVALALGGSAAYLAATKGIPVEALFGEGGYDFGGVLWDPVIYGGFGLWVVWYVLWVSMAATVAASMYPIWFATRVNPAKALRVV